MSAAAAPRPVVDQPSSADPSASSLSPPQSSPSPSPSSPSPSPSSSRSPSPSPSSSSYPSPPPRTRGPTPMDLAWRQVALDEAAGRLHPLWPRRRPIERLNGLEKSRKAKPPSFDTFVSFGVRSMQPTGMQLMSIFVEIGSHGAAVEVMNRMSHRLMRSLMEQTGYVNGW